MSFVIGLKNEISWEMGYDGELGFNGVNKARSSFEEVLSQIVSSELQGDESLFAYLNGFGVSYLLASEKRMKIQRLGYKRCSFGYQMTSVCLNC